MSCPVIIVDDDIAIRESLAALMQAYGYAWKTFTSGTELMEWFSGEAPFCLLLDKNLPNTDGLDLISQILSESKTPVSIIMITGFGDIPIAVKAMQMGATDFIEKPIDPDRLIDSIKSGQNKIEQALQDASRNTDIDCEAMKLLSKREIDVVKKLAEGQPNKIVAYELGISQRTVEVHRSRIMKRTGAKSFAELIRMAIAAKII
ncbi:MAG: response regulator transcription factor [Hyphomonadaceae bacterium]|nr:response regulator transcription factor [Hyphomonadaceae bacterium]